MRQRLLHWIDRILYVNRIIRMNVLCVAFVKLEFYGICKLYLIRNVIRKQRSIIHAPPSWTCNGTCYGDDDVHVMTKYHWIRAQSSPRGCYHYNYYVIYNSLWIINALVVDTERNYRFCAYPKMHCSSYRNRGIGPRLARWLINFNLTR